MKKEHINQVRKLQKIAGLLKEDFELPDESPFDNAKKGEWKSNLDVDLGGIEIYNDGENRLFVIFDKNTGVISVVNDWNGEDFDEVWSTEDLRPVLLKTLDSLHEDFELPDESPFENKSPAAQAFQKAEIDLNKPVTYFYIRIAGVQEPVKTLGRALLKKIETEWEDMDEAQDFSYQVNPSRLLVPKNAFFIEVLKGLKCKLHIYEGDEMHTFLKYEIWQ